MSAALITIGIIIVLGIIVIIGLQLKRPSLPSADPGKDQKIRDLEKALKDEEGEKNKLIGKNKELFAQHVQLQAKYDSLQKEKDRLSEAVTKFEANEKHQVKTYEEKIENLESARKAFEKDQKRINDEALARRQMEEEEHDRLWTEHENHVIYLLTDLCKKPEFNFTCYNNTNLPDDFHSSLKPDFLIEFLEQYVIFDAKISKADNLQVYINDQVKKTAVKVKGKEKIYHTIYLVVPTHAIGELKKTYYFEEGFHFFIISPEAIAPIFSSLKRIESYEFAENRDPEERETIIDLITQFDYHVSLRNYIDYHLIEHGLKTLGKTQDTNPDFAKEVAIRKTKMRAPSMKTAELKAFVSNPELLQQRLIELTEPKSQIAKEDIRQHS
ncbi:MAG: hypothetical protein WC840_02580 [Candidatus Peribacteraceae bacterium]